MDLFKDVQRKLSKLDPSELRVIESEVDGVSISWLSQIARGTYSSVPTYRRLQAVSQWLERRERRAARASRKTPTPESAGA